MKTLSVALAVYNEEKNIGRCLSSVSGWCDEIVIADGNSTDSTVSIASRFKPVLLKTENRENFHINKQIAIDKCTGSWILQLDADEELTERLKREISIAIKNPDFNGYWIPRKNFFLGKFLEKGGQFPDYTLRLYRRGKGRLPQKSVHEQAQVEGKIGYLQNPMLHFAYPDFSLYLIRFDKYTSIFTTELKQKKVRISASSFFRYFFLEPFSWFFRSYIRHKGFQDGFPGFIFSLFSSLRFPVAYIKLWEIREAKNE